MKVYRYRMDTFWVFNLYNIPLLSTWILHSWAYLQPVLRILLLCQQLPWKALKAKWPEFKPEMHEFLNDHTEVLIKKINSTHYVVKRALIIQNIIGKTKIKNLSINLPYLPPFVSVILVLLFSPQFNYTNSLLLLQEINFIFMSATS